MSFYSVEYCSSRTYWFKRKDGTEFKQDFRSTTEAIDYARNHGYEFIGTHGHVALNRQHPNYYLS